MQKERKTDKEMHEAARASVAVASLLLHTYAYIGDVALRIVY